MRYSFVFYGRLPNLNDYTAACRGKRGHIMGAIMKNDNQTLVEKCIKRDLRDVHITSKVMLHYRWFEPNDRRDVDNISGFGHKIIQDAIVECGIIPDDSQKYIKGYTDRFYVDKAKPRIEVDIEEVNDGQL